MSTALTPVDMRPIPGFPGYFADSNGAVWSKRGRWDTSLHPIRMFPNCNGYLCVTLRKNGRNRTLRVHRFVALAFHGEPPADKPVTRHLDGNQLNNVPSNLAWGTATENAADILQHGRRVYGERVWNAKLTTEIVLEFRSLAALGWKPAQIARIWGFNLSTVSHVLNRRSWRHVPEEQS